MALYNKYLRKNLASLEPYSSARHEYQDNDAIYFDANENPYNVPYNRYPDPFQLELKTRLAAYKGVKADQIFTGNGSDEIIDLLIRAFCEPGIDNILIPEPSYGMYEVCARVNNVGIKKVLLKEDFNLDPQKILDQADSVTKMIFICSPNNPTSNSFREQDIIRILNEFKGIIIIDEAYIDFSSQKGFLKYLDHYPDLVILQTFSKAWGMAGIRLGIGYGDPGLIHILNRIKYPYNVSLLTQKIALEMLDRRGEMEMWIRNILEQRKFLEESLGKLRFVKKVYPSDANFLLIRVDDPVSLCRRLASLKLIIRNRSKMPMCKDCVRITVGTAIENKILIDNMLKYQTEINSSGL